MAKLVKAVLLRDYELDGQPVKADSVVELTPETAKILTDFGLVDTNKGAIDNATNNN